MKLSSEELKLLKKRDAEILKRIYETYKNKLLNYFLIKTNGNRQIAEELVSDTFYSAIVSAPSLKKGNNVMGWLFTIANRRFTDYLRNIYKNKKIFTASETELLSKEIEVENNLKTDVTLVLIGMDLIKPEYRKILNMKYIEKKKYTEMADELKISEDAVRGKLERARSALKKWIIKIRKQL